MAGYGRNSLAAGLVVLLALSGAATAAPGTGALVVEGPLGFLGATTVSSDAGAFFVGIDDSGENAAVDGAPAIALQLQAARVNVTRVTIEQRILDTPIAQSPFLSGGYSEEWFEFERATLGATLTGGDGTRLVLNSTTFHRDSTAFAAANGAVLRGITLFYGVPNFLTSDQPRDSGDPALDYLFMPRATFETFSDKGAAFDLVADDATLYLYGFDLEIATDAGRTTLTSGETVTSEADALTGLGVGTQREAHYLYVRLEGVTGAASASGAKARWFEPTPILHVDGTVVSSAASGLVRVDGKDYSLQGDAVTIRGGLDLVPTRTSTGERGNDAYEPAIDPSFRTDVSGDVQYISVTAARPLYRDTATAAAVATGVAGLALVAVFWQLVKYWVTVLLIPLYTRLKEPEILDNEVRNQIYEIIRQNPGISARAVHRAAGQSWGTVVYHLRQLERHHLVTSKRVGRSRNFYENHGKYRGMEVELATLKAPRAADVARVILQEPGLTQERLTELAGLPQPTTSYYVRKLKEAKLIEDRREGRYVHYFPVPELPKLLALATAEAANAAVPDAGAPAS